ncbi:hypothetical protein CSC37_4785 [Escherichia coli]|nr:hypothetical protein PPECC33_02271 [Escherichia coli PCN033]RCH10850.1 hypothetical protein CSC37_4785 [Escherichia coli]
MCNAAYRALSEIIDQKSTYYLSNKFSLMQQKLFFQNKHTI